MINRMVKGRRLEHKTRHLLEAAGYMVVRAAGSKGAADLVALRPPGDVRLLQIKAGTARLPAHEREQLQELADLFRGRLTVELWRWPDRKHDPLIEVL